jgi:hypothetical protein
MVADPTATRQLSVAATAPDASRSQVFRSRAAQTD